MTKYLIVEDERLAYQELKRMMEELRPEYVLAGSTGTVATTIDFLNKNEVDLILLDVHLSDGDCFEIFNHIRISKPIIFTTAYDEHAIKAFKLNSIDYLLKPIEEEELSVALDKYEDIYRRKIIPYDYKQLEETIPQHKKHRFLIQKGDSYFYINSVDIAFFYSEDKVVFIHTFENKRYIVDYTLDKLENHLEAHRFFRVARNCITNIKAINKIHKYHNSRLKLSFKPGCPHEVIVSRVRIPEFLKWIDDLI